MDMTSLGRCWRAWRRHWHRRSLAALRSPRPAAPAAAAESPEGREPLACAIYARLVALRRRRELALGLRVAARVPVLSVGNVTFGATGKTPMVQLLVGLALRSDAARVPLLLSRGYGDDEWRMLARKFTALVVALGADRVRAGVARVHELEQAHGRRASELLSCVVLDDGLQQWRLAKDLELVMVDALHPFGNGRLLPLGSLREHPRDALARADVAVLHHADLMGSIDEKRALMDTLRSYMDPSRSPIVATSRMQVTALVPALRLLESPDASEASAGDLEDCVALVWCGVGNPESVRLVVERWGARTARGISIWHRVEMEDFPDHHAFSAEDVDDVLTRCRELREQFGGRRVVLVTTEKDLFRNEEPMRRVAKQEELLVLQCELQLMDNRELVEARLKALLAP